MEVSVDEDEAAWSEAAESSDVVFSLSNSFCLAALTLALERVVGLVSVRDEGWAGADEDSGSDV
jgi:hypothetical protein